MKSATRLLETCVGRPSFISLEACRKAQKDVINVVKRLVRYGQQRVRDQQTQKDKSEVKKYVNMGFPWDTNAGLPGCPHSLFVGYHTGISMKLTKGPVSTKQFLCLFCGKCGSKYIYSSTVLKYILV